MADHKHKWVQVGQAQPVDDGSGRIVEWITRFRCTVCGEIEIGNYPPGTSPTR
jgi:hypothetical protein